MTENQNTEHHVFTDQERAFILDPDTPAELMKDVLEINDETAHIVQEFTHIGDSKEHDPLRIKIGFETIETARSNVARIHEVLNHPDVPQEIKDAHAKLLDAMAVAGQVALDLRLAEIQWDSIVAEHGSNVQQDNPLAALIGFLEANLPKANEK